MLLQNIQFTSDNKEDPRNMSQFFKQSRYTIFFSESQQGLLCSN